MMVILVSRVTATSAFGHDPDRVRELARDVLSGPPFHEQRPSLLGQLLERLGAFVAELFGRLFQTIGGDTALAWFVVAVGGALLVAAVWRWTRGVRVAGGVAVEVADPGGRSSDDWIQASDAASSEGDLDRALRFRYLGVVAALVERGILDDVPGRTIRELDADLAAAWPGLAEPVAAAGARVERVAYAGAHARPGDVEVVDTALAQVVAGARGVMA